MSRIHYAALFIRNERNDILMPCKMEKELSVFISQCDSTSKMSMPSIFTLFGDLASEHAPQIGLGSDTLAEKDLFWVAVRTKIKVHRRPEMTECFRAFTWPEAPGRVRCVRYYSLTDLSSALLAEGKTEWAIVDLATGRPHKLSEIYPEEMQHLTDTACDEPFGKIAESTDDTEHFASYTVRSTDIDIGQHMNNAAYIRAVFGAFTCAELEAMNISDIEINFKAQCYEGDELSFYKRKCGDAVEIVILRPDSKCAATVRLA